MSSDEEDNRPAPLPLLGICDPTQHDFHPVTVTRRSAGQGGDEEFETVMVCSHCGYARKVRDLEAASESLTMAIVEEIAAEGAAEPEAAPDAADPGSEAGVSPGGARRRSPEPSKKLQ